MLMYRLNDKDKIEAMGIKLKDVMDLAISTISAMTFSWGSVTSSHPQHRRHIDQTVSSTVIRILVTCSSGNILPRRANRNL